MNVSGFLGEFLQHRDEMMRFHGRCKTTRESLQANGQIRPPWGDSHTISTIFGVTNQPFPAGFKVAIFIAQANDTTEFRKSIF